MGLQSLGYAKKSQLLRYKSDYVKCRCTIHGAKNMCCSDCVLPTFLVVIWWSGFFRHIFTCKNEIHCYYKMSITYLWRFLLYLLGPFVSLNDPHIFASGLDFFTWDMEDQQNLRVMVGHELVYNWWNLRKRIAATFFMKG